jgi:hypothetical protein
MSENNVALTKNGFGVYTSYQFFLAWELVKLHGLGAVIVEASAEKPYKSASAKHIAEQAFAVVDAFVQLAQERGEYKVPTGEIPCLEGITQ